MSEPLDIAALLREDAWARRLARSLAADGGEDLVQEAYVRALARSRRATVLREPPGAVLRLRPWLARVLANLAREVRRRDQTRSARELRAAPPACVEAVAAAGAAATGPASPAELAARAELQERLAHEVLGLEPELREAVLLHHFQGLSQADVARALGVARTTAQGRIERAHAQLRARLGDVGRDARLARGLALLLVPPAVPVTTTAASHAALALTLMSLAKPLLVTAAALALAFLALRRDGPPASGLAAARPPHADLEPRPAVAAPSGAGAPAPTEPALRVDAVPAAGAAAPDPTPAAATVAARVVDERGAPVAGASVQLVLAPDEVAAHTVALSPGTSIVRAPRGTTDADGLATLPVPSGRPLELEASHVRGPSSTARAALDALAPGGSADVELRLAFEPDVDVALRVVAAESGAPLAGVAVHTALFEFPPPPRIRNARLGVALPPDDEPEALTDAAGACVLRARSWTRTVALLATPGRAPRIVEVRAEGAERGSSGPVEVALEPAGRIEGRALGAPPGCVARVALRHFELGRADDGRVTRAGPPRYVVEGTLDGQGRFALEGLPPGLQLAPELFSPQAETALCVEPAPIVLAPGETRTLTWEVAPSARIVCTCLDQDGAPIVDETVWLRSERPGVVPIAGPGFDPERTAKTDAQGRARFDGVRPGRWLATLAVATRPGAAPPSGAAPSRHASFPEAVDVPASGGEVAVELRGARDLFLRGVVLRPDGTPGSALVMVGTGGFSTSVEAWARTGGAFEVGPLPPGAYGVSAYDAFDQDELLAPSETVVAAAGTDGVELRMRPAGQLSIDVLGRDGTETRVWFWAADGPEGGMSIGATRLGPEPYLSPGLAAGRYSVGAALADGRAALATSVQVAAGRVTPVVLAPVEGGVLRVAHVGSEERVWCEIRSAGGDLQADGVRGGEARDFALPPGSYHVRVLRHDSTRGAAPGPPRELERHGLEVRAGATTTVEVGR